MIHTMRLNTEHYDKIASGNKSIELRVYDEKRRSLQDGHVIIFENRQSRARLEKHIDKLDLYENWNILLDHIDINKTGYTTETRDQLLFDLGQYYSDDEVKRWGVVAINLK